ncbi:hypothetical protein CY35_03G076600 [Sphagnum magellanicum]|nr:hypothetical protein CY35_03G076600 [Sphagnum magellanicum]
MSSFYSPQGIQVENLSLLDRLTALPLIQALLEFDLDDKAYSAYDAMTARELFRRAGVSAKLYHEFLEPILLVTLFAPGEQLSAAAALGALYYYVLAHQADFDVCWCKGSVAELIFQPWIQHIENQGGRILGGKRVSDVILDDSVNKITGIVAVNSTGETEVYEADAVVFAVGVQAMQRIVASSSALAERPEFSAVSNLGTIDILATRLWLDQRIILRNPSNVIAGFEPSTGATLFDLNALQTEFADNVGSVLEVDFFHANQLIPLEDDAVIDKVMKKYLTKCDSRFKTAKIVDASVLRFKSAVTLFAPGSHQHMPTTKTSFANAFMAGDWLQQGPGSHGARGLSQEKAFVTGILAANEVARSQAVNAQAKVIEVEEDEAHIALLKSGLRHIRQGAQALGVESPFI